MTIQKEDGLKPIMSKVDSPAISGVYFLLRDEEVVYVGSSKDLIKRVEHHFSSSQKQFDSFTFIEYDLDRSELEKKECEFIFKYAPIYNKAIPRATETIKYSFGHRNEDNFLREYGNCKVLVEGIVINSQLYIDVTALKKF